MPTSTTIDFGIDLGTTNSGIAVLRGQAIQVIKNNRAQDITPSAVFINKNAKTGQVTTTVGESAKSSYVQGKEVVLEFKRDMGSDRKYTFAKAGVERTPVELSAEVLKALRGDVQRVIGEVIDAVVITVPAVFPEPSCSATKRAAEQAGFKEAVLIQEPVAAAMVYGYQKKITELQWWLVFDFGGGTFDAALLKASKGMFSIQNHKGDNFLGGADIDWDILKQLVIPQLTKDYTLPGFRRGAKQWEHPLRLLKYAVEQAKITLSGQDRVDLDGPTFEDEAGAIVDYSTISLSRADIAEVARSHIEKAVNLCKELLAESKLKTSDLSKVILVGGPTQAPYFRDTLKKYFGDIIDFSHSPMTVVAEGAAIFASQKLKTISSDGESSDSEAGVFKIDWLNYNPVGTSTKPMVSGKLSSPGVKDFSGFRIDFLNKATGVRSGATDCGGDGTFIATLHAKEGERNFFEIEFKDAEGIRKETDPKEIHYTISSPIPKATVINSLGIALADGTVEIAFEKGETLPQKKKHLRQSAGGVFHTTGNIKKGNKDTGLCVTVVEGENRRADLNRVIGEIVIDGSMVPADVSTGTEIEIYLKMDEDRSLFLTVVIPDIDKHIRDERFSLEMVEIDPGGLRKKYNQQIKRAKEVVRAMQSGENDAEDQTLAALVDEVSDWESSKGHREIEDRIDAAMGKGEGWTVAAAQADQLIREFMAKIYELEDRLELPKLIKEVEGILEEAERVLMGFGAALPNEMRIAFQQMFEQAQDSLKSVKKKAQQGFAEAKEAIFDELERVKSKATEILFIAGAPVLYSQLCGQEFQSRVRPHDKPAYQKAMQAGATAIERGLFQDLIIANQRMLQILHQDDGDGDSAGRHKPR